MLNVRRRRGTLNLWPTHDYALTVQRKALATQSHSVRPRAGLDTNGAYRRAGDILHVLRGNPVVDHRVVIARDSRNDGRLVKDPVNITVMQLVTMMEAVPVEMTIVHERVAA
jgi:hypothetical protein